MRFVRQRSRWIGALATPLLFWLLIGRRVWGLGMIRRDRARWILGIFLPGIGHFEGSIYGNFFDHVGDRRSAPGSFARHSGSRPLSRSAFVAAKILGGASLSVFQGGLLLTLAPMAGIALTLPRVLALLALLFIVGGALTALGFVFAWKIDSVQGYHGVMNMVLVPMWILSGAVFPAAGGFGVFAWLQKLNPLAYGVSAFRMILFHPQALPLDR